MQQHTSQNTALTAALPAGVPEFLTEFAVTNNIAPGELISRYGKCPFRYSLDDGIAIGKDPALLSLKLAGISARSAGSGTTFGFHYLHTGLVLLKDQGNPGPIKRTTIFLIDSRAMHTLEPEPFTRLIGNFDAVVKLSNHDPLHSLNGDPVQFTDVDAHLRFGGVEFAPLVAHAANVQLRFLKNAGAEANILNACMDYLEVVKTAQLSGDSHAGFSARLYFVSLPLRHLLLVLPKEAQLVQSYLKAAQSVVFEGREVTMTPDRARKFLHRDFSGGDHADPVGASEGAHTNRTTQYEHGKNSILGPWYSAAFANYFGADLDSSVTMPMSEMLLVDTLMRGHGIFGLQSAIAGDAHRELVRCCVEKFTRS